MLWSIKHRFNWDTLLLTLWCFSLTYIQPWLVKFKCSRWSTPFTFAMWKIGFLFFPSLLFSRVTNNLPSRSHTMTPQECFQTFIRAIFYVGKGKRSRPYSHLYEALEYHKGEKTSKVKSHTLLLCVNFSLLAFCKMHLFFCRFPEVVPQSATHPSGLGRWTGSRLPALFPERHPSGGVHQRGLHGGGHRWVHLI